MSMGHFASQPLTRRFLACWGKAHTLDQLYAFVLQNYKDKINFTANLALLQVSGVLNY